MLCSGHTVVAVTVSEVFGGACVENPGLLGVYPISHVVPVGKNSTGSRPKKPWRCHPGGCRWIMGPFSTAENRLTSKSMSSGRHGLEYYGHLRNQRNFVWAV